jgi:hypothetical protein
LVVQATGDPGLTDLDLVFALVGDLHLKRSLGGPVREPDERPGTDGFDPSCTKRLRLGAHPLSAGSNHLESFAGRRLPPIPWALAVIGRKHKRLSRVDEVRIADLILVAAIDDGVAQPVSVGVLADAPEIVAWSGTAVLISGMRTVPSSRMA